MGFIASKLLWMTLRPSSLLLWLALLGWLCRRRLMLALGVGGLAAVTLLPVGWLVLRPLEDCVVPPPLPDPVTGHVAGIILLGGAVDPDLTETRGQPAVNGAAARMLRFVALARSYPDARLLFTGGRGVITPGRLSEADVTRMIYEEIGFARPIEYESRSRTTRENAVLLAAQIHPQPDQRWILVTSADHMPRAALLFGAAGWNVVPAPAGYVTGAMRDDMLQGLPAHLAELDVAAHEWGGLIQARLMGWTPRLLP